MFRLVSNLLTVTFKLVQAMGLFARQNELSCAIHNTKIALIYFIS